MLLKNLKEAKESTNPVLKLEKAKKKEIIHAQEESEDEDFDEIIGSNKKSDVINQIILIN